MRISDWSSDVCSSDLVADQCIEGLTVPGVKLRGREIVRRRHGGLEHDFVGCRQRFPQFQADPAAERGSGLVEARIVIVLRPLVEAERQVVRSEECRVGKGCVSTFKFWWSPYQ